MDFLTDILNKKGATRAMTDEEFERLLPEMALELSKVDYHYHYTDKELKSAWEKLCKFKTPDHYTASQQRSGMPLCEHFFPNFYDITNSKQETFAKYWTPTYLEKIIKWNRSSHQTPYLSEFKRGVYFCYGLTKNTMYRPHLAKMICDYYKPQVVLDPCCGWGGRMLGTVAHGAKYIGFEPNTQTYNHLNELADYLGIKDQVCLYCAGAETLDQYDISADLVLTSPPYFDLEIYSQEPSQSIANFSTYAEWKDGWLTPVIQKSLKKLNDSGVSCWNVAPKMQDDVENIHRQLGWNYDSDFGLHSSARQANQNIAKNKKTTDATICYKKN